MSGREYAKPHYECVVAGVGKIRITHRNFDKFTVIPKCNIYIHLLINQNVYKPDSYLPHTQLD
jgi:hypothetical protein